MRATILTLILATSSWSAIAMGHGGNANSKAWDVCVNAKTGDTCEFRDHHDDLNRGTCRSFDEKHMCVRNKPIVAAAHENHVSIPPKFFNLDSNFLILFVAGITALFTFFLRTRSKDLS